MNNLQRTIPNMLTMVRIAIIPIIVCAFFVEGALGKQIAAGLFFLAGITDYFDGKLARAWKVESKMGKFLDPIADKLLVATVIIMLIHFDRLTHVETIAGLIILCREIFVSGLREYLGQLNVSVPVSNLAKYKTGFQMLALFLLTLGAEGSGETLVNEVGGWSLGFAALLTIVTGYAYLKTGLKHMD